MNYYEHTEGINKIVQLIMQERIVPIFGAGFTKGCESYRGTVPDGDECTDLMKEILKLDVCRMNLTEIEAYNFNEAAKRLRKAVKKYSVVEKKYTLFLKNYFTDVKIDKTREHFLQIPWPFVFTINVDDGIENTGLFNKILPYHKHRKNGNDNKVKLFKLHGDASYELNYDDEKNIIFDSDQYTQSINDPENQTMRDCFSNAYKEFNLLFIGCSLRYEPDIKYIYNSIVDERLDTMGIILRKEKLTDNEEDDLAEFGVTDVIIVSDYDVFYLDLYHAVMEQKNLNKSINYPFYNPKILTTEDNDLKFFSGYKCFDEGKNIFNKSELFVNRDCLTEIENSLMDNNIVFIEGRRFSGKTALLSIICEREKRRNVFYFPSTTQESLDVIKKILDDNEDSLLIFDSNSVSSELYFYICDISELLKENKNKIIIMSNQSDSYVTEILEADYIKLKNVFSKTELDRLVLQTNKHALTRRKLLDTNLDYLDTIKNEQNISLSDIFKLPNTYTKNEQILLILLCVKDKVYSRDIWALGVRFSEIQDFQKRTNVLVEWVKTSKGEKSTYSTHKLVHNSKNMILGEVRKISHQDIVQSILSIVNAYINGDNNQKRIYHEVMQFDTLNQLFGRKKGAGRLISDVYKELEIVLKDDLHFWLQRSKSIYRLVPEKYWPLRDAYKYAKKVYIDSDNLTLKTKAALSVSLISGLLCRLERKKDRKIDFLEEGIRLGHEAVFSEYYKQEKRLQSDLNADSKNKNYAELLLGMCSNYAKLFNEDGDIFKYACEIERKLSFKRL